ncbi:FtsK/SpoIIIE domain-containing protein [Nocardia sp. NPDC050712]|uniref:FtsK/SpoIIIE domain-containing protein n=1 Tax=Actinomycetes TaxID=1760 RepID=UPI003404EB34
MGNNGIGAAIVVGTGTLTFGSMVAYTTAENLGYSGWSGPGALVVAMSSGAGLVVAHKVSLRRRTRREIERAYQRWLDELAKVPAEVHYAVETLADPMRARDMWTNPRIAIGLPPNAMFSGTWPQLVEGQDPGHHPDPGFRHTPVGARVRVRLPQGPSADELRSRLPNLAVALNVQRVQIMAVHGNVVSLELRIRNPLLESVPLRAPEPSPVPLKALLVGVREDGGDYRLRIWSNHLFLAGLTGSGKSGVLWSIIAALAPDIKAGRVELHVIDLKFGTEMSAGYRLFASFSWEVLAALDTLEMLCAKMAALANPRRETSMREGTPIREFDPSPGNPQQVLMIDEILDLLKISGEFTIKRRLPQIDGTLGEQPEKITVAKYAGRLLLSLLSRARSFGITVIVSTQNAAKEIFELLRDMFPTMVGLRLASEQQVQMVFGVGAAERGIFAKDISPDEPGVVFVDSPEEGGQAMRARHFRVSNEDIIHLVRIFGRPAESMPPLPVFSDAAAIAPAAGNVYALRPAEPLVVDADERPQEEEQPLAEQVGAKTHKCRFCGREIQQRAGGRPALYCPGTDHRQQYHRLKKRLEAEGQ